VGGTQHWLGSKGIPAMFALSVILLSVYGANRLAFAMAQSGGLVCRGSGAKFLDGNKITVTIASRDLCAGTGYELVKGFKYRVTFEPDNNWGDPVLTARGSFGADGYAKPISQAPHMLLALPMRRVIGAYWFALAGRIGTSGDEQYLLSDHSLIEARQTGDCSCSSTTP